jgi:hypothetical protein
MYCSVIELHYLMNALFDYEPGIYTKIGKYCGVHKDEDFTKWFLILEKFSFINKEEYENLESPPNIKTKCSYFREFGGRKPYTAVWGLSLSEYCFCQFNERLGLNIAKKEYKNLIYGKKEWDIYDDVNDSLYKNLGLYKCDIEQLKKLDINKCTLMFHCFTELNDIKRCIETRDYTFNSDVYPIHIPTHFIEIIPTDSLQKSIILKGFFVDMIIRHLRCFSMTSDFMETKEYNSVINEYYSKIKNY